MKPTPKAFIEGVGVLAVLLVIVGFMASERASQQRLVPTGRASTLSEYLDWQPASDEFAAIELDGRRHIIAYGPMCGWLPSGPSAYVFDDVGRLVDWSSDIGDHPAFDKKWGAQRSSGEATLNRNDAKRFADSGTAK